ncbi:hypothetical protein GLOIN_2v1479627 [Rhizophagus clarus]|uniref:Uncharacterized protein n=1 Tax=Rhizophagus clarus TaxID=94130 RepID=A0A8H3QM40_9GLOM|nr:hypothetical protein GLOIN_2v1479627 [Rhizophagus clarus]
MTNAEEQGNKSCKDYKNIRTYVATLPRDYNKERDERREEGSEHEQDNLHWTRCRYGKVIIDKMMIWNRIIFDMLPEQEERNIEKERRENEKKEMERRDKERKERRKKRKEEERERKRERGGDRREKDKEQEENENDESESEEEIPVQFGAMTNQLQICNWLVLHPSVLHLANKMLDASTKQPSTNLPLTTSTSSPSDNWIYGTVPDPTDEESGVETESANIKEKVKELDVITEDLEIPSR